MAHKVLIADDDRTLLTTLTVRLKAEGYDVTCVQDSYQAVAKAGQIRPDVLILDVNMPAGEGFTVQDRLEKMEHVQNIPAIYLTGERSLRVAQLAQRHNAIVVYKPFETDDLLTRVKAAIASKQSPPQAAAA